jgi:hypothetical protein
MFADARRRSPHGRAHGGGNEALHVREGDTGVGVDAAIAERHAPPIKGPHA